MLILFKWARWEVAGSGPFAAVGADTIWLYIKDEWENSSSSPVSILSLDGQDWDPIGWLFWKPAVNYTVNSLTWR